MSFCDCYNINLVFTNNYVLKWLLQKYVAMYSKIDIDKIAKYLQIFPTFSKYALQVFGSILLGLYIIWVYTN